MKIFYMNTPTTTTTTTTTIITINVVVIVSTYTLLFKYAHIHVVCTVYTVHTHIYQSYVNECEWLWTIGHKKKEKEIGYERKIK